MVGDVVGLAMPSVASCARCASCAKGGAAAGGGQAVRQLLRGLLLELRDRVAARGAQVAGPVARLREHDAVHNTILVDTLRTWLNASGDPEVRFAVLLQLRLRHIPRGLTIR